MLLFPPVPESHEDLLENASNRHSKQPAKQSEEFGAREEREKGDDGMNSNGCAENAWREDLPDDHPLKKREIYSDHERHYPPLWESRQDTQHSYHVGTYHRDKVEEKEERSQQSCVWDVQQRQPNTGSQCSYECNQQISPKVSTQALIDGVQQEVNGVSTSYRSFEAEPANDAWAINDKVDTERDHDDEVDDVGEQPAQEREQPGESGQHLRKQMVLGLGNLVIGNAKLFQKANQRLNLTLSSRAQQELDRLRERG